MQLDESRSASTAVNARVVTFGSRVLRLSSKIKRGWSHV